MKRIKKLSEVPHAVVGKGQQGAVVLGKGVEPVAVLGKLFDVHEKKAPKK